MPGLPDQGAVAIFYLNENVAIPKHAKLPALTSLRFFAASMIVLFHFSGHGGLPSFTVPLHQGVSLFFVLSGFLMLYNYPALDSWPARREFLIKRFARLWPAHLLGITATIIIMVPADWQVVDHIGLLTANLLMVQTWVPLSGLMISLNGPSWSISTEFAFYILFLFLIIDFRRTWWWKLLLAAGVVAALIAVATAVGLPYSDAHRALDANTLLVQFPLARALEFVIGMCSGLAFRRWPDPSGSRPLWTLMEIVALAFCALEVALIRYPQAPLGYWLSVFGIAVPAAILIFVLAYGRGAISKTLAFRPMVFLGDISYSMYLLHVPTMALSFQWLGGWPNFAAYAAALLTVSSVSYLCWEAPARRAIIEIAMLAIAHANAKRRRRTPALHINIKRRYGHPAADA